MTRPNTTSSLWTRPIKAHRKNTKMAYHVKRCATALCNSPKIKFRWRLPTMVHRLERHMHHYLTNWDSPAPSSLGTPRAAEDQTTSPTSKAYISGLHRRPGTIKSSTFRHQHIYTSSLPTGADADIVLCEANGG